MSTLHEKATERNKELGMPAITTTHHGRVDDICRRLYDAMEGMGTDEDVVLLALDEANEYGLVGDVSVHWFQHWGAKHITNGAAARLEEKERTLEGWLADDFSDYEWYAILGGVTAAAAIVIATGGLALAIAPGLAMAGATIYAGSSQQVRDGYPFFRFYGGCTEADGVSYWSKYQVTDQTRQVHMRAYAAAKMLYEGMVGGRTCIWCDGDDVDKGKIYSGIRVGHDYCIMEQVREAFMCFFGEPNRSDLEARGSLLTWLEDLEDEGDFFDDGEYEKILNLIKIAEASKHCEDWSPLVDAEDQWEQQVVPIDVPENEKIAVVTIPKTDTNPNGSRHNPPPPPELQKTTFPHIADNGFITMIPLLLSMSDRFGQLAPFQNEIELVNRFNKLKTVTNPDLAISKFFKNNSNTNIMNMYPKPAIKRLLVEAQDNIEDNFSTDAKSAIDRFPIILGIGTDSKSLSESDPYQMALLLSKIGEQFPDLRGSIMAGLREATKGDGDMSVLSAMCERATSSAITSCDKVIDFSGDKSLIEELQEFCSSNLVDTVAVRNKIISGQLGKDEHLILDDDNNPTAGGESTC